MACNIGPIPGPNHIGPDLKGWPLHPLNNQFVPYCLLMLRNDFNDFAFEHRFGCCATEPGYAGDIGAIEIWLID